jgi:hypothetical protein
MIWLLLILFVLVVGLTYVLFAPFYLEIDSTKGLFRLRFHLVMSARVLMENSSLILEIKSPIWNKQVDLLAQNESKTKPIPKENILEKKRNKKGKRVSKITFSKIKAILHTFKINTFYVNLDFDDVLLNAKLFPVFLGLKLYSGKELNVNFIGENKIKIEIENNMARVILAFIFK